MKNKNKLTGRVVGGVERWQNVKTGEVIDTISTEFVAEDSSYQRSGFMIMYAKQLFAIIDELGNKKMQVVKYVLENIEKSNNILVTSNRKIASETGISYKTVSDTLKLLEDCGIIHRELGAIMINPKFANTASKDGEQYLLYKFNSFGTDKTNADNENSQSAKPITSSSYQTPPND